MFASLLKMEAITSSETLVRTATRLHGVTTQKTTVDILTAVITSDLRQAA
jgi:hypothetical protein